MIPLFSSLKTNNELGKSLSKSISLCNHLIWTCDNISNPQRIGNDLNRNLWNKIKVWSSSFRYHRPVSSFRWRNPGLNMQLSCFVRTSIFVRLEETVDIVSEIPNSATASSSLLKFFPYIRFSRPNPHEGLKKITRTLCYFSNEAQTRERFLFFFLQGGIQSLQPYQRLAWSNSDWFSSVFFLFSFLLVFCGSFYCGWREGSRIHQIDTKYFSQSMCEHAGIYGDPKAFR